MNEMPSNLCWAVVAILFPGIPTLAVAEPPRAQALIERFHREKSPVWADGNAVTFYYRGQADQVEVHFGGDIRALNRLADSDVWTATVQLADLERAVFSYHFVPTAQDRSTQGPLAEPVVWRGPQALPTTAECTALQGTLEQFEVESKALGSQRKVTVYRPPQHDPKKPCRVIYAADGQAIDRFARVLEPLIVARQVPPVVIIGVHHGGYVGGAPDLKNYDEKKDLRLQEYFPGFNAKRFADHEAFFCTEIPAWAERRFGVSSEKSNRVVFGYSNGGRFAVEMGLRHPDRFGHVFGFSVAGKVDLAGDPEDLPRFYLAAGTWEATFHVWTSRLAEQLMKREASVHFSSRVGGHDAALWRDEFAATLLEAFGKK
jgi:enterochelin esterase-like enzyme